MSREANILVVDDDRPTTDMLIEWLEKRGYSGVGAYGGQEGIEAFEQGDYDLVITDLAMPGIDGMALLETVKVRDPRMAVLMVSGLGTIEKAVLAIKKGAYDFVTKPVDFEHLEESIDRALERRGLLKQLGIFRGLTLALIISIPFWLILGIILTSIWR